MKMIRFSHEDYEKFRRVTKKPPFTARLLQVFLVQSNDISEDFREYDTTFYTEAGVDYYPLNRGRTQIVLLFEETETGLLFTTMRSANTSKLQYYKDSQGNEFKVIATGV
jgi:hypothetical protein